MIKIAYYEIKKMLRDYRLLIVFFIQPVILIYLLGNALIHDPEHLAISVYNKSLNSGSTQIVEKIKGINCLSLNLASSEDEASNLAKDNLVKASVIIDVRENAGVTSGVVEIIENATVPEMSAKAKGEIISALEPTIRDITANNSKFEAEKLANQKSTSFTDQQKLKLDDLARVIASLSLSSEEIGAVQGKIQALDDSSISFSDLKISNDSITIKSVNNTDRKIVFFDYYASAVIALLIMLIALNSSVTTISQERIDGTFERFFVTPYTKASMIFGKMLAYVIVSLALALITIASLAVFFDVTLGPIWLVLLITFINGLAAIALGILISSFTYSIAESIQVGTLIFFTILILTGLIFQPETMHPVIQKLHQFIPFTYAIKAMREVNILGFGFGQVYKDLLILFGSALGFLSLAVIILRRKAR